MTGPQIPTRSIIDNLPRQGKDPHRLRDPCLSLLRQLRLPAPHPAVRGAHGIHIAKAAISPYFASMNRDRIPRPSSRP